MTAAAAATPPGKSAPTESSFERLRHALGLPLAIIAGLAVWSINLPDGLSPQGHHALALFTGVFVLYLTEAIPLAITSLMVVPAAVLMKTVPLSGALTGFASSSVWLIVGAFVLAGGMVRTRLAERITYKLLLAIGCTPTRITLGITIANMALAFLIPSSTARTAALLPVCMGIAAIMAGEGRSRFAVNILLTLAFTNSVVSAGILTAGVPNPVTVEFLAKAGQHVTYTDWLIYGFPPAVLMAGITWALIQRLYPPEAQGDDSMAEAAVRTRLDAMGPTSSSEWRALSVYIAVMLGWVTQAWTGLDTTVCCLIGAGALFLPKFGVLDWEYTNRHTSWQIVLVVGGGISLGDILMRTGAAKWLAVSIFNGLGLETAGVLAMLIGLMVLIQFFHIAFVGTTVMATAFLPIVMTLAQAAHINPLVLALPAGMLIGGYPLLMFYNTLPNIIVYGTGRLKVGDFPKVGVPICLIACVVYAICAMTYWRWLGLFAN
jgi:solute carrier family 13 (sodium-dependent dicarboxylate transporter), member 2/3/5